MANKLEILSATDFSDLENPVITYTNPLGNNATELVAGIFDWGGKITYVPYRPIPKTGSIYTFELTEDEKEALGVAAAKTGDKMTVAFYIRQNGGSGTVWVYRHATFTVYGAPPEITGTIEDVNPKTLGLTGDKNKLVKFHSNAKITMEATAKRGAAIDESLYVIRHGDSSFYGTSAVFEEVETNGAFLIATDSRYLSTVEPITADMVEYIRPTCNIVNNRPDALGRMTVACTGNYFKGNFGAVENTLKVEYRDANSDVWKPMEVDLYDDWYYAEAEFTINPFNQTSTYSFQARVSDCLEEVPSKIISVKNKPLYHWGENDFVFEVPVTFKAGTDGALGEGDQHIKGNLRLKGDGNYGNYLYFGGGSYCFIGELEDDEMTLKADKINLVANGVYVDGYAIPILERGIWSPTIENVSSYTTQYGWYMKMGQTVTVGFFIKAWCDSMNADPVIIHGLPFTPMFSAAGGGLCSGADVSSGKNFQCFVAEKSGDITTRVQNCEHTGGKLETSKEGCTYPVSLREITLSGTITFMANS